MKIVTFIVAVSLLIGLCGCPTISKEIKDEVHLSYARTAKYVELMDDGKTKPEQDKKFIKASLKVFAALDLKINDNKEAKKHLEGQ